MCGSVVSHLRVTECAGAVGVRPLLGIGFIERFDVAERTYLHESHKTHLSETSQTRRMPHAHTIKGSCFS